ncbi:hypothetical protein GDO86_012099 [Hymenochirus boettgeri]|uniref:RNA-binding protein 33 n=1 Tax=Hymenochirus boettgeri TaxID=247094 RepID=A0A8T2JJR1_9PIPI|nr:hypothetical protein GDO86_012099 [Hymenochirus boettgeri]
MAALLGDDDFDQFDKPGAERFRRKRSADDWDSELEDDLLEEDILPGKKNPSDLSDEELNDDLLQSDEDEQETGYGVAISLNATAGGLTSFELSKSVNEDPDALDPEAEEGGELAENAAEPVAGNDHFTDPYETNELADESAEYIEIEPLDEFQEEDYSQQKLTEDQEYTENFVEEAEEAPEEIADEGLEAQDVTNDSEEVPDEHQEVAAETKEDSDEEDEEEEDGGRIRFKTERKEGTIIRLSDATRARRNIPETLELSAEAKASLQEFEEMERQRKGRYSAKRWKRGGNNSGPRGMGEQRHENNERRNMREQRPPQGQPIRSLFQQQQIQPLLPMQRSRNPSSDAMTTPTPQEKQRMGGKALLSTPPQPKNIHINPHFKGNVAPVQVPLLPVPNQPRPQAGPPRFPGMPEFPPMLNPPPNNFTPPPRFQEPWRNPPPPQEREPFFIGEPRFPNQQLFDQRNPPPGPPPPPPPPPLLNNHPIPNQGQLPFSQHNQGFNQPNPQPRFNQPGPQPNFNQPGPQPGFTQPGPGPQQPFNQPGPPAGFNQPGFHQPGLQPGFNQPCPQPGSNQPNFSQPGPQPGFNQVVPPPGFNQQGLNQPAFNQPQNVAPPPRFNPPTPGGPQPNFNQPGPGPQQTFNLPPFSRERPVRISLPSPGPMGVPPFSPSSPGIRPFPPPPPPPPRQQFPPAPGQQFMPHVHPNIQASVQPPMQHLHQQHHLTRPPNHKVLVQQPFRARLQSPRTSTNIRQRPGLAKPRQGVPLQNIGIGAIPQMSNMRNSNLRELPVAPTSSLGGKPNSAPSAQVKPIGTTVPQARASSASRTQVGKQANITIQVKEELKPEEQFPDEDEETRNYRLKIEEQKRLREAILRQKELRRQQQAGARKKELMERLSQQQQTPSAGLDGGDSVHLSEGNLGTQMVQQGTIPQQRPQLQQRLQQQQRETVRKVTLVKSTVQQQQHQYNVQQFQGPARPLRSHSQSVNPQLVNIVQGQHQPKKVVMRGRGRGLGGQMGRGRLMPNKQNLRVVECNPQPCAVALEGLSSSTTDNQLKNMLTSVGPIRHVCFYFHC